MSLVTWVLVALGGGAGATARLLVDEAIRGRWSHGFPAGIFVVNISGALLIGVAAGTLDGDAARVAMLGVLGGYTTFSTWMLDSFNALADGRPWMAAANLGGSIAAGLLAVQLGSHLV